MSIQYMDMSATPATGGIDSYSSKAKIPEGFVEDALNMDVDATGKYTKRAGYETSFGWLPLRAKRFVQSGTSIRIYFDTNQIVSLDTTNLGPLVVFGKLPQLSSYGSSSFSDEADVVYFSSYSLINKDSLSGTSTLTKAATETDLASKYTFLGLAEASSPANSSNEALIPTLVQIDTATFNVTFSYTVSSPTTAYFLYAPKPALAGSTYIGAITAAGPGPETFEFTAATHGLTFVGIGVKVFDESGGVATEVIPDLVYITAAGTVGIIIQGTLTGYVIISTTPADNIVAAAAVTGVNTLTVPSPPSPFCFYYVFFYNSATSRLEQVVASLIYYNDVSGETEITYELAAGSESVQIYYEEASTISNIIELTDVGSATIDTEEASIVIWGLGHQNIYNADAPKGGWIHHLDDYKSVGEEHLVSGVNGCFYYSSGVADTDASWLLPTLYPSLFARVDGEVVVGPLFAVTSNARTRGNVLDASITLNRALVTGVAYVSTGVVDVTLSFTNKTGAIAIGSTISTLDLLSLSGMGDARNVGDFPILSVQSDSTTAAVIRISNTAAYNTTINEAGIQGRAGVFTDEVTFTAAHSFIPNDVIQGPGIADDTLLILSLPSASSVLVSGATTAITLVTSGTVYGKRSGRIIPLKGGDGVTASVEGFVRGDSISSGLVVQKPVLLNVQTSASFSSVAAATLSGTTLLTFSGEHGFNDGGYLTIFGDTNNLYNGEWPIDAVPTTLTVSILTPQIADDSSTVKVLGKCIELDEEISWWDDTSSPAVSPYGRWLPIEAPDRGDSVVVKDTTPLLLNSNVATNQPNVASTVVSDSMFFTNGEDAVYKYDGGSIYKAGLTRTIPSAFMTLDTSVTSIQKGFQVAYTAISTAGKFFTIGSAAFKEGDRIFDSISSTIFVVTEVRLVPGSPDTYNVIVAGDTSTISFAGTPTLTLVRRFRYYVRFNAIDINNNVIASNAANSSDMFLDLTASGRIVIKFSSYLIQGFQNYERLEVELYRTLSNSIAPFFLTKRLALDASYTGEVALEIIDDNDDTYLTEADSISSALLRTEIGSGWQPAYRAKHVSTLDNRLLIANLKSWPKWDITIKPTGAFLTAANLSGVKFLFRNDNTSAATTSNFEDRQAYEYVTSGAVTPTSIVAGVVTKTAHGLVTGNWIYLYYNAVGTNKDFGNCGWFQITKLTDDTFSLAGWGHTNSNASEPDRYVFATTKTDIPVWLGVDGNYNQVNGNIVGSAELVAARRLADAINFSMSYAKYIDKEVYPNFTPWMTAYAGGDYKVGQILIECQLQLDTTPELVLPTLGTTYSVFVNGLKRVTDEQVSTSTLLFPSRVGVSYKNYPEMFDRLDETRLSSDSVIDINPADGQDITAIIPFFGESTFGGAMLNQVALVFKPNSIYVLDLETLTYQRLDSRGVGCTAPFSVTSGKDGVMFANRGSIYQVTRSMTIRYIGKRMQGKWKDLINIDELENASATHWGLERKYKLSLPANGEGVNSQVFTYSYDREEEGLPGAWTRYDNFNATLWCNQREGNFFGSTQGIVYQIRQYNTSVDYRDDTQSISSVLLYRAEDFGLPGVRKTIPSAILQLDADAGNITYIDIKSATNLSPTFQNIGTVSIDEDTSPVIRCSVENKKGTHLQIKILHDVIDENLSITGVNYQVGRLDARGVPQAAAFTTRSTT